MNRLDRATDQCVQQIMASPRTLATIRNTLRLRVTAAALAISLAPVAHAELPAGQAAPAIALPQTPDLLTGGFFVGVNYPGLDGWFNGAGHIANVNYLTPVEADFEYFASRGIKLIRFQFRWEHLFQLGPDSAIDPAYLDSMRQAVQWAHARSMGVVLDMHNYATYDAVNSGRDSSRYQIDAADGPTSDQLAAAWGKIVIATKDWPGLIGYDTMNEPIKVPNIGLMQQKVVNAIRKAGALQAIAIEGNHFSTAGSWVADGNEALYDVTDPLNRLIIEAHAYPDCDSSGTHQSWAIQSTDPAQAEPGGTACTKDQAVTIDTGARRVAAFVASATARGKRIWLGELGASQDEPWRLAVDNMMEVMRAAGGFVTYWSAGAGYGSANGYDVEPQPPGAQPGNVIDTSRMANVEKYTGFTAIPYGVTGPAHGAVSEPAVLGVIVHGWLPRDVRVTPSDGGVGGRFSLASITVPAGFNGSPDGLREPNLSVAYTPPAKPQVISIRFTNDGGLTDPAPYSYSTKMDALVASHLAPVAVFSDHAIDTAWTGPALTLRRGAGDTVTSYAPSPLTGELDLNSLRHDAGSTPLRLTSMRNTTGPGGSLTVAPATDKYPTPSPMDEPAFLVAAFGGRPAYRVDRSRMQAAIPLGGLDQACVFVVGQPRAQGYLVSWVSPAGDSVWSFPGDAHTWDLRLGGGSAVSLGGAVDTAAPHAYAMCFDRGAMSLFVDGAKTATGKVSASVLPPYESRLGRGFSPFMNVGYFANYNDSAGSGYATGLLRDIVVTKGPWTDEAVSTLSTTLADDAGIRPASRLPGPMSPSQ